MGYVRTSTGLPGRARGRGRGLSGLGADATPPAGLTTAITGDPIAALVAQVNRFARTDIPAAYKLVDQPYPVPTDGQIPVDLATSAVLIMQRAALDPFMQGTGTGSVKSLAIDSVALADPVTYVTGNLATVIQQVGLYADSVKLPAASSTDVASFLTSTPGMVLGGLVLLWLVTRKQGRRK